MSEEPAVSEGPDTPEGADATWEGPDMLEGADATWEGPDFSRAAISVPSFPALAAEGLLFDSDFISSQTCSPKRRLPILPPPGIL